MWDLPGPGLEPMSPALAGGFLTTAPPGKPHSDSSELIYSYVALYNFYHLGGKGNIFSLEKTLKIKRNIKEKYK